jgi:hypothetical protein
MSLMRTLDWQRKEEAADRGGLKLALDVIA